ncbi:uncharacterized protein RMCT_2879, partial [Mycolicibacterium thermoresistibile]
MAALSRTAQIDTPGIDIPNPVGSGVSGCRSGVGGRRSGAGGAGGAGGLSGAGGA